MWQKCAIYEGTRETIKIEQSEVLHSKCKPAPQTLYLQLLLWADCNWMWTFHIWRLSSLIDHFKSTRKHQILAVYDNYAQDWCLMLQLDLLGQYTLDLIHRALVWCWNYQVVYKDIAAAGSNPQGRVVGATWIVRNIVTSHMQDVSNGWLQIMEAKVCPIKSDKGKKKHQFLISWRLKNLDFGVLKL